MLGRKTKDHTVVPSPIHMELPAFLQPCWSIVSYLFIQGNLLNAISPDAEQKESELMVELCNCPMLDSITPLMSWSNTPIGTPRRTPLPTPHGTPLITPRATPRCTPRGTPRATPTPMSRMGYNPGEYRSPSRTSMLREEDAPPPRRRFVQAPEIFSSFSSKQVSFATSFSRSLFIRRWMREARLS